MNEEQNQQKQQDIMGRLEQKYQAGGQNVESYLEGLFYTDYLNYWDYIHSEALLSLQTLRTTQPDELVFIVYHQSSELYFKLILSELGQICADKNLEPEGFGARIDRVCRYWQILIDSFEVMQKGMDPEQFRRFRMVLMPASGFQSVQYRQIEIASTDLWCLASPKSRPNIDQHTPIQETYAHIYWKQGAIELESQAKTLTLLRFEQKYDARLMQWATGHQANNIRQKMLNIGIPAVGSGLYTALRTYDYSVNVAWPMAHWRAASHYLHGNPNQPNKPIAATGGTNWQKYLPASTQKRMFFPELWSEQEKQDWGKIG